MHRARTVSVESSPLDAQARCFGRPPISLTGERTRIAEQQYTWPHYCRGTNRYADRGAPTTGTASEPILTKGSAGLPTSRRDLQLTTAGHRVNRLWPLVLTQPVRCPAGVPVRFPPTNMTSENALAAPALPRFRPYRPFRWGGLCVSRHNRKNSSQSYGRRVRHPICVKTEAGLLVR